MRRSIFALFGATTLVAGATFYAQTHAETVEPGVNVGSLVCTAASAASTPAHHLDCLFARSDGVAEAYHADVRHPPAPVVDGSGAPLVWAVFAAGTVAPGALAGDFGKPTEAMQVSGLPHGAFLVGGEHEQIVLAPVRVPGRTGLNVAEGVSEVALQYGG